MADYFTLGAQLPTLKQGDYRTHQLTSREFVDTLLSQAPSKDRKLVELLLLREDNALLLQLLRGEDEEMLPHKTYVLGKDKLMYLIDATRKRLAAEREAISECQDLDYPRLSKEVYPKYMQDFVSQYLTYEEEGSQPNFFYADLLMMAYAEYVQKEGNSFLRRWFKLEHDIAATFAALTADKYKLERDKYILGDSPLYNLLRAGDWSEISYADEGEMVAVMRKISEEENLAIREQKIDDYKWKLLDEETFTDIFSINAMLVYLLKLQLLERWEKLDKVQGEQQFRHIVSSLNKNFKVEMQDFKKMIKEHSMSKRVRRASSENED